jgi:anti-anti-sigma regulatory factor
VTERLVFQREPPRLHSLTVTLLSGRTGLRLVGEADIASADVLRRAIAALPPDPDEIHLQLSALDFADVCAARELVALTRLPSCPLVILHDPPAALTRVIRLLWPDIRSQLVIKHERGTGPGMAQPWSA